MSFLCILIKKEACSSIRNPQLMVYWINSFLNVTVFQPAFEYETSRVKAKNLVL